MLLDRRDQLPDLQACIKGTPRPRRVSPAGLAGARRELRRAHQPRGSARRRGAPPGALVTLHESGGSGEALVAPRAFAAWCALTSLSTHLAAATALSLDRSCTTIGARAAAVERNGRGSARARARAPPASLATAAAAFTRGGGGRARSCGTVVQRIQDAAARGVQAMRRTHALAAVGDVCDQRRVQLAICRSRGCACRAAPRQANAWISGATSHAACPRPWPGGR